MEDDLWEVMWLRFIVGIIIDASISLSASVLFADEGEKWQTFAIALCLILFLRAFFNIRDWIQGSVFYYYFGRHYLGKYMLNFLRKSNLPVVNARYETNLIYYLKFVAENKYLEADDRVKAAAAYSGLTAIQKAQSGNLNRMMDHIADEMLAIWVKERSRNEQ